MIALTEILPPTEPKEKIQCRFELVRLKAQHHLAVCKSKILLGGRRVVFSLSDRVDEPVMCHDAPLSTIYVLSSVLIVKPFVVAFALVGT